MAGPFRTAPGLSRLITRAEEGEEVIIARAGKPVARLARLDPPTRRVRFGVLKGKVRVADDFDAPLPEEIVAAFEGR